MILIRLLLILLITFLVIKAFLGFGTRGRMSKPKPESDENNPPKKVSKEIGEYVDYEEVKKEKQHSTSPKS
jgi:hypothetical protein